MNDMKESMNFQAEGEQNTMMPKKSGLVTTGLILGIIGAATAFIPIINNASFVLGILALIFGGIGLAKKQPIGKSVTALVLGVLAIVITLVMQMAVLNAVDESLDELDESLSMMNGERTDDVLRDSLSVTIGKFQVIEDEYWDETKLEVTLKNKSGKKMSFNVTIEAEDEDGNRLDVDYIYVSDLGAGQSQKFDLFTLVTSDKIADYKTATFRVVEASAY